MLWCFNVFQKILIHSAGTDNADDCPGGLHVSFRDTACSDSDAFSGGDCDTHNDSFGDARGNADQQSDRYTCRIARTGDGCRDH